MNENILENEFNEDGVKEKVHNNEATEAISKIDEAVDNTADATSEADEAIGNTDEIVIDTAEAVNDTADATSEADEAISNADEIVIDTAEAVDNTADAMSEADEEVVNIPEAVSDIDDGEQLFTDEADGGVNEAEQELSDDNGESFYEENDESYEYDEESSDDVESYEYGEESSDGAENESDDGSEPDGEDDAEEDAEEDASAKIGTRFIDSLFDFIELFIFSLAAVFIITTFFFRHSVVDGTSMERTLFDGEHIIISDLFYKPERGDIIVCEDYSTELPIPIVKRVIGISGDRVQIDAYGNVKVNGELLDESGYVYIDPNYPYICDELDLVVPDGEIFVMGDHRNVSSDSRKIGTIKEDSILGKVLFRFYPFEKFGKVE